MWRRVKNMNAIINRHYQKLVISNLLILFLIVTIGMLLRNGSQNACPDWPTCYGNFQYPDNPIGQMHFWHRVLSAATYGLSLIIFLSAWKSKRCSRNIKWVAFLTIFILTLQVILGWYVRESGALIRGIHYLLAILALISTSLQYGLIKFSEKKSMNKYTMKLVILFLSSLLMVVMGILVSAFDAASFCSGFPICNPIFPENPLGYLVMLHRLSVLLVFISLIGLTRQAWERGREDLFILLPTTVAIIIFIGQIFIGATQVFSPMRIEMFSLHAVLTAGYFIALGLALVGWRYGEISKIRVQKNIFNDSKRRKDLLQLNKPIIVALLLVTTYAGMIVAGKSIPGLELTIWTMIAGALAAGGSSAVNQYIDRRIDLSMQRTAQRPLPSGRMQPAEALTLGISEIIISFFIYVFFVNLLAAVLAMVGMFYYVVIYSLWLKHATVQNIVIGGGAGAIPPLVGWAAVTGSLNVPALFLFALIFLWTPPHFWALAIVRKNDYARASVPMLPVIKGEKYTRIQIFLYTLQLVILTLVMPLFGLGGSLYFVLALILGGWILHSAWMVLKREGNKVAFKMYRYSSMYLVFIFLALVVDVLI